MNWPTRPVVNTGLVDPGLRMGWRDLCNATAQRDGPFDVSMYLDHVCFVFQKTDQCHTVCRWSQPNPWILTVLSETDGTKNARSVYSEHRLVLLTTETDENAGRRIQQHGCESRSSGGCYVQDGKREWRALPGSKRTKDICAAGMRFRRTSEAAPHERAFQCDSLSCSGMLWRNNSGQLCRHSGQQVDQRAKRVLRMIRAGNLKRGKVKHDVFIFEESQIGEVIRMKPGIKIHDQSTE